MKTHISLVLLAALFLNVAVPTLRAQVVNDGTTNTLSNITNSFTGDVTVGTNGAFTLLVLSDNSVLTNSVNGVIGRNATAKSNEVRLISATARWRLGGSLFVGSNGALSRLIVSNGALVENNNGTLGSRIDSSNNLALITGGGSVWSNRNNLDIGGSGPGNQMIVSNGGWVASRIVRVGVNASSSNDLVLVTGSGSVWSNAFSLTVGNTGPGNRLVIEAGGLVNDDTGTVGDFGSASNNEALVTGPGSLWMNRSFLTIGNQIGRNRLVVSNGASVWSGTGAISTFSNQVVVTGAGSLWSNQNSLVLAGGSNRVDVSDGGWLADATGDITGTSNTVMVTGSGSGWDNSDSLLLGDFGNGHTLIASNGATVLSSNAMIGASTSLGNNNFALITGAGTLWSNRNDLVVGNLSVGNQLAVSNGAMVFVGTHAVIGMNSSATSNLLTVTDSGSTWTVASILYVGSNGPLNRMVVANGGLVASDPFGIIGNSTSASNNEVVVTGPGSLWTNGSVIFVGSAGGRNRLVVTNGGEVQTFTTVVGSDFPGQNEALVTGVGSLLYNRQEIHVGSFGYGNRLVVSDGGTVVARANAIVGLFNGSLSNRVTVDGGTLSVTNPFGDARFDVRRGTNALNAGLIDVDQLVLTNAQGFFEFNGGTLITRGAVISNGVPFIVGNSGVTPAVWDVRASASNHLLGDACYIGNNSAFNQLLITNGASLLNDFEGYIGVLPGANSNAALIAGSGSRWTGGEIFAGLEGSFNRLVISNGGFVSARLNAMIGSLPGSRSNLVLVTGSGSTWTNATLFVGGSDSGNQLIVSGGGLVQSGTGFIGFNSGASNNTALINGAGSTWSNSTTLIVGRQGAASQLIVSNGALVFSAGSILVGTNAASTNNRVVVDSGTLRVTNAAATGTLDVRRGLFTQNSGRVEVDRLLVTNTQGSFQLHGGTLSTRSTTVGSGIFFHVGDNIGPATMFLEGNGTHVFSSSLSIDDNSILTGNGTIGGIVLALNSGTISPGAAIGKMIFTDSPLLLGRVFMEISKNGATLTNDQIQILGPVSYDGSLTVSNLGPSALAAGDKFKLFNATSYAGSFSSLTLPPLAPGLTWANKLLVDGSIEVVAPPAVPISSGSYTQNFDSLSLSGANNFWRDNSTLLGWYAAQSASPFTITNYRASDGSENNGALYSFGLTGSSERALGSIPSDAVGSISYGIALANDTSGSISDFTITYTGEQWRSSGAGGANTLTFWYRVSASALTNPEPGTVTDWTEVPGLNFVSPTVIPSVTALDGNQATNRQTFSAVLVPGLVVPPGQNVFFRWHDINDDGADHGLGVDDVIISFSMLAPQITSVGLTTNHFLQITGQGESNSLFGIEAATNLIPPIFWQRLVTNTTDSTGLFQFTDTNAPAFPTRFYRTLTP